jgi:nitroimidazol reductase NimA-like FMN-containing flavoprotein (pyridoxamine 5'-phosphate oxidase superfamily)
MRRRDKRIEDKTIITEIFSESVICRVALSDTPYPYIVPMNYGYADGVLYFHGASEGRKLDLIRKNNKVAFEIEQGYEVVKKEVSCRWTTKYRSIIGVGKIEIVTDFDEKRKGLDIIMSHHGREENEYEDNLIENIVVLKLIVESFTAKQSGDWK